MFVQCPVGGSYCHVFSGNTKPEYKTHQINLMGKGRWRDRNKRKMYLCQAVKTALKIKLLSALPEPQGSGHRAT